jgi:purine-binding chemotaxis protein CheW
LYACRLKEQDADQDNDTSSVRPSLPPFETRHAPDVKYHSEKRPAGQRQAIDWQQVRERLATTGAALRGETRISPEAARALLEERARVLAQIPATGRTGAKIVEVLTFTLAQERYAIETRHVQETARFGDCTPVPGAPEFLVGLMNLRGNILGVIDLRKFFGLAQSPPSIEPRSLKMPRNSTRRPIP